MSDAYVIREFELVLEDDQIVAMPPKAELLGVGFLDVPCRMVLWARVAPTSVGRARCLLPLVNRLILIRDPGQAVPERAGLVGILTNGPMAHHLVFDGGVS